MVVGMVVADFRLVQSWLRRNPLALAFGSSLIIHLWLYGFWWMGKSLGWWDHQATWLMFWKNRSQARELAQAKNPAEEPKPKIIPMTFVEVDPATAVPEPPKETKYYGAQNSLAANPDPVKQETEKPKVDGEQKQIIRLADNPKPKPFPLQPALPPEEKPAELTKPKPDPAQTPPPGNLTVAEPERTPSPADAVRVNPQSDPPKKERVRTVAAARAQSQSLAGQKMAQEGGVRRRGSVSLDVKSTPFGAYDLAFIRAVEKRWFDLLDSSSFVQRTGKVVLEFRLNSDGRITDLTSTENEVGEILGLLCQRAIQDPAPYAPWPSDMRRAVGGNYREVTFTFYYN